MEQIYYWIGLIIFWIGGITLFLILTVLLLDKAFGRVKMFVEFRKGWVEYYVNKEEFNQWQKSTKEDKCICETGETGWCEKHKMDTL
jgi:hypothetical protein